MSDEQDTKLHDLMIALFMSVQAYYNEHPDLPMSVMLTHALQSLHYHAHNLDAVDQSIATLALFAGIETARASDARHDAKVTQAITDAEQYIRSVKVKAVRE